ncbi:MAG TPA: hypothetical protein V6C72_00270 [Chroococcales cyanobacterium]
METSSNRDTTRKTAKRKILTTSIFWTLVAVVALNLLFPLVDPTASIDPAKLPSRHTWEWWRTRSFLQAKKSPDVVVLGSSLVMIPLAVQDADYLNKDLDAVHHPQSIYMQDRLKESLGAGGNFQCFNFGLPGGMVSDDYMIARALLTGAHKPKVVVLGLTLRDFIENHVPCAAATGTFKYFQHFFPIDDLVAMAMPQFWQRFEYGMGRLFSLWGKRLELQLVSSSWLTNRINPALNDLGAPVKVNPVDATEIRDNLAQKLKTVAEEGDFILKAHQFYPYEDNSNEYRKRLKSSNAELFRTETLFLDKLLSLLAEQGTQVVIVNMPLTEKNMELMPPGSYQSYRAVVQQACNKFKVDFVDLNDGKQFVTADFRDTAHMNSQGGRKLIDDIVAAIGSDKKLQASLTSQSQYTDKPAESKATASSASPPL